MTAKPSRYVVCGPPDSGKTTWVTHRAVPGDIVWDFDDVAAILGNLGQPLTRRSNKYLSWPVQQATVAMREGLIVWLRNTWIRDANVYFIVTDPLDAQRIATQIHAIVVRLPEADETGPQP